MQVTAALEVGLGVGLGLASFAAVRRGGVAAAALAGLLAGTFGVHLAAGYLSNLAMAAAFVAAIALLDRPTNRVAAIALLDRPTNRAAVVAALVLAGSGLAHPQFFFVGIVILGTTAVVAWRSDRAEAFRIAWASLGGGVVVGAGLLAVQVGPAPPDVDTSRDAFLRRAGLLSELRSAYVDRFVHRWTRYVQWLSVPLAIVGFVTPAGTAGRIMRSWFVVTVVGVAVSLATGWLPADRFITFGFAIPILAAFGVVRAWGWLRQRRAVAVVVTAAMVIAMLAGSWIAWNRHEPFLSDEEVTAARVANETIATLPNGTPLSFWVNEPDSSVSFLATRAGNVIRASVPTDRIRDVVVVVPPGGPEDLIERRALARLTSRDVHSAQDTSGRDATIFVLEPFDVIDSPEDAVVIDLPVKDVMGVDPLEPLTPFGATLASVAVLVVLGVAGYGWGRIGIDDVLAAAAAAPAVGAGVVIVAAVALDAVGVSIGEAPAAIAALALGGGGGYLARFVLQRRARTRPAPQVEEQPPE